MSIQKTIKTLFGLKVREARLQSGLSQESLAELTDLHRTYISEVERGLRNISLENIYRLSIALEVKMPELFDIEEV